MFSVNEAVNQVYDSITHNQHKLGIISPTRGGFWGRNHNYHNLGPALLCQKVQSLLSGGPQFCNVGSVKFAWDYNTLEIFKQQLLHLLKINNY